MHNFSYYVFPMNFLKVVGEFQIFFHQNKLNLISFCMHSLKYPHILDSEQTLLFLNMLSHYCGDLDLVKNIFNLPAQINGMFGYYSLRVFPFCRKHISVL